MRLPVSLAFLDLDHFKLVNDEQGHLVGSELLAQTGRRLRELSRKQDRLFPLRRRRVRHPDARDRRQRRPGLCPEIAPRPDGNPLHHEERPRVNVSASVGLATAPADGATVHTIIGAADARMYLVKLSGRGTVRGA